MIIKLILSVFAGLGANVTKKYYTDRTRAGAVQGFVFGAATYFAAAVFMLCLGGFGEHSRFTVLLGILFGVVTAIQGITHLAALQVGPMSYTSVIISFSTLIPTLSGAILFDESLGAAQIVGIALMLVSFILSAKSGGNEKSVNFKWMLLCLISFVTCGSIGVMQKIHQSTDFCAEINALLTVAFISSAVLCAAFAAVLEIRERRRTGTEKRCPISKRRALLFCGIMIASGICVGANNKINLYLSGVMDSALFFPTVNGGTLILTALAAVILFKEKLTLKQWIGIAAGIASVIFLCNPFA